MSLKRRWGPQTVQISPEEERRDRLPNKYLKCPFFTIARSYSGDKLSMTISCIGVV
jgi:hypothetical protein